MSFRARVLRLTGGLALGSLATVAEATHPPNLGPYHTYDEMVADLQALETAHPSRAQLISIGHGWEIINEFQQRQIWALKISDNVGEREGEPEIVFVGAHHAREWISVEVPLALAHHLLENYSSDPAIQDIVDNKVVWIIPMLNPDGHVHSATVDRCWRKNRRNNGDGSFGVDPNRNYGYQWASGGSSGTTTSDLYHGPAPFSEPENQAMRDFLRARTNLRAVVSYHSYTQAVLRPWAWTLNFTPGDPPPPGEIMLKDISDRLRDLILGVHSQVYKDCLFQANRLPSGGCPSPPHYAAAGEFTDWVYHEFNVPAYTIEVRPQSYTTWPASHSCPGFELPTSQITPTIEENIPPALALIHYAQPGDIMIRDHASDDGTIPSSTHTPSGWNPVFWLSPDIWSDPATPVRGETATITAQVHNLTGAPVHGATIQVFFSDPSINLEFPNPDAVLLGEDSLQPIPPNGSRTFDVSWNVPSSPNAVGDHHWCIGVVVKHPDDLPISTQALYSNNVAHRNFAPIGTTSTASALRFLAQNSSSIRADLDVHVKAEDLPEGWKVTLDPNRPKTLAPGERYLGFAQVAVPQGAGPGSGEVEIHGALRPRRPGAFKVTGSGVTYAIKYRPLKRTRPEHLAILRSHEDLLKGQQRLIDKLGKIHREALATREVSDDRAVDLLEDYQRLVSENSALIRRFEHMIRDSFGTAEPPGD